MLTKSIQKAAFGLAVGLSVSLAAIAQTDAEKAIDRYRELVADGNPAELWEAKGEDLWKKKRGPKNASLEKCDLGLGPGVVKGAYVSLPRYFDDVKKVQDLETRLVTCMDQHQGIKAKAAIYDRDDHKDVISLVAWIDNTRIRLQGLPNLTNNEPAGKAFTSWPAYRVSNSQLWPMQKRLEDCFRQQRFPYVEFGSDVTIALSSYMGVTGKGVKSLAPTIKR